MNDDERSNSADSPDALPDELRAVVASVVQDPVPDDLTPESIKEKLRDRVASFERVNPRRAPRRRWTPWILATAVSILVVATAIALNRSNRLPRDEIAPRDRIADDRPIPLRGGDDESFAGPSLWNYHRTAAESFDQMNSLMDQHAATVFASPRNEPALRPLTTSLLLEEI